MTGRRSAGTLRARGPGRRAGTCQNTVPVREHLSPADDGHRRTQTRSPCSPRKDLTMNDLTSSRPPRPARALVEPLEERRLLSVSLAESEPNDTRAAADAVDRVPDTHVVVGGNVNAAGDKDWFKIRFNKGDVFGAAVTGKDGLDPTLRLVNAAGVVMVANDNSSYGQTYLPPGS